MELNEVDIEDIGFIDENNIFNPTIVEPPPLSRTGIIKTLKPISTQPQVSQKKKNKISYDDLLSNMGMSLVNGKLELYNKSKLAPSYEEPNNPRYRNANDYRYHQNI